MSVNIVIYTDPRSLEHDKTVRVFRDLGLLYVEKDCKMSKRLRSESLLRSGSPRLPQVFIGRHHVNGLDDLVALADSGMLLDYAANQVEGIEPVNLPHSDQELEACSRHMKLVSPSESRVPRLQTASTRFRIAARSEWSVFGRRHGRHQIAVSSNRISILEDSRMLRVKLQSALGTTTFDRIRDLLKKLVVSPNAEGPSHIGQKRKVVHIRSMQSDWIEKDRTSIAARVRQPEGVSSTLFELAVASVTNHVCGDHLSRVYQAGAAENLPKTEIKRVIDATTSLSSAAGFLDLMMANTERDRNETQQRRDVTDPWYPVGTQLARNVDVDIEDQFVASHGFFPNWMTACPRQSYRVIGQSYLNSMFSNDPKGVGPHLRHLMALVSAIATGHDYLANLHAFLAGKTGGRDLFCSDRIRFAFAAAVGRQVPSDLFSDCERVALSFAYRASQTPVHIPRSFVVPMKNRFTASERLDQCLVVATSAMVQRLVAIKRKQFDLEESETPVRAWMNAEDFAFGFMESRYLVDPAKSFITNQSKAVA